MRANNFIQLAAVLPWMLGAFFLLVAICMQGCDDSRPQNKNHSGTKPGLIVAFGDSLTVGLGLNPEQAYPTLLEKKLQAEGYHYTVVNAGVSSETSDGALARIDSIIDLKPDIVILETGANDGLRGIEPQTIETNLRQIIERLGDQNIVLLLTGMRMPLHKGPGYMAQFNDIYPRVAKDSKVLFMPFILEGVAMKSAYNQSDGVHPNAAGQEKISENLYPYLLKAIKEHQEK